MCVCVCVHVHVHVCEGESGGIKRIDLYMYMYNSILHAFVAAFVEGNYLC